MDRAADARGILYFYLGYILGITTTITITTSVTITIPITILIYNEWIERRTPKALPLRLPPGATHCHVYIYKDIYIYIYIYIDMYICYACIGLLNL